MRAVLFALALLFHGAIGASSNVQEEQLRVPYHPQGYSIWQNGNMAIWQNHRAKNSFHMMTTTRGLEKAMAECQAIGEDFKDSLPDLKKNLGTLGGFAKMAFEALMLTREEINDLKKDITELKQLKPLVGYMGQKVTGIGEQMTDLVAEIQKLQKNTDTKLDKSDTSMALVMEALKGIDSKLEEKEIREKYMDEEKEAREKEKEAKGKFCCKLKAYQECPSPDYGVRTWSEFAKFIWNELPNNDGECCYDSRSAYDAIPDIQSVCPAELGQVKEKETKKCCCLREGTECPIKDLGVREDNLYLLITRLFFRRQEDNLFEEESCPVGQHQCCFYSQSFFNNITNVCEQTYNVVSASTCKIIRTN